MFCCCTCAGACDVAGGAGSVNALPAGGAGAGARLAPSFDAATPRNVTALVGKSAYLSCRVRNLGNRTVSQEPTLTASNTEIQTISVLSTVRVGDGMKVNGDIRDKTKLFIIISGNKMETRQYDEGIL